MVNEIQKMADRAEGKLVSQKESPVLRPGERTHMLGVTVGDSGVFEALGRDSRPRPSWAGIERRKRVSQDRLRVF